MIYIDTSTSVNKPFLSPVSTILKYVIYLCHFLYTAQSYINFFLFLIICTIYVIFFPQANTEQKKVITDRICADSQKMFNYVVLILYLKKCVYCLNKNT